MANQIKMSESHNDRERKSCSLHMSKGCMDLSEISSRHPVAPLVLLRPLLCCSPYRRVLHRKGLHDCHNAKLTEEDQADKQKLMQRQLGVILLSAI